MDEGRRLFEFLSEPNKRRALQGTLPSDFFSTEKMRQLNAWIESSGTTVESYFTEVETMSVREREVRELVDRVGLEYDESASVEENSTRAGEVLDEFIATGTSLPSRDTFSPEASKEGGVAATVDRVVGGGQSAIDPRDRMREDDRLPSGDDTSSTTTTTSTSTSGGGGGGGAAAAAAARDANQAQVEELLASQFGGFAFFLQKHRSDLQVGLTADGQVVAADDPDASTVKNILDVIVDQGITAPTRVLGMVKNTEWWQATDAKMREYDVLTADMSQPQKTEYLEPVLDLLREEAQFLGFQLDPTRARDLAEQITRMGEENDSEYIRGLLTAEESFNAAEVTASRFAATRDDIVAMSKRYFTPINEADAAQFAQDVYVGTKTTEGVEQYFREMAANKFPQLENSLNAGITPEQYFAPYKYEIERMLDRPNVDLYEEFGDVVQFIPDTGTGEARPMTLGEVRKYVRGLDEWQQSSQGKEAARALAFSIGRTFGEVA